MTVKHLAWLKFKSEISEASINHHMEACRSLVGKVPALQNLECGADGGEAVPSSDLSYDTPLQEKLWQVSAELAGLGQ